MVTLDELMLSRRLVTVSFILISCCISFPMLDILVLKSLSGRCHETSDLLILRIQDESNLIDDVPGAS